MPLDHTLSRMNREDCLELLATEPLGRVGISVDALPAIVPVLIAVMDGSVVFRTVPGTKLAYAVERAVLALEVDRFNPDRTEGWSVLVRGVAAEITDPADVARARALLARSWIDEQSAEHFVRISADLVTGRRLVVAPADRFTARPGADVGPRS